MKHCHCAQFNQIPDRKVVIYNESGKKLIFYTRYVERGQLSYADSISLQPSQGVIFTYPSGGGEFIVGYVEPEYGSTRYKIVENKPFSCVTFTDIWYAESDPYRNIPYSYFRPVDKVIANPRITYNYL